MLVVEDVVDPILDEGDVRLHVLVEPVLRGAGAAHRDAVEDAVLHGLDTHMGGDGAVEQHGAQHGDRGFARGLLGLGELAALDAQEFRFLLEHARLEEDARILEGHALHQGDAGDHREGQQADHDAAAQAQAEEGRGQAEAPVGGGDSQRPGRGQGPGQHALVAPAGDGPEHDARAQGREGIGLDDREPVEIGRAGEQPGREQAGDRQAQPQPAHREVEERGAQPPGARHQRPGRADRGHAEEQEQVGQRDRQDREDRVHRGTVRPAHVQHVAQDPRLVRLEPDVDPFHPVEGMGELRRGPPGQADAEQGPARRHQAVRHAGGGCGLPVQAARLPREARRDRAVRLDEHAGLSLRSSEGVLPGRDQKVAARTMPTEASRTWRLTRSRRAKTMGSSCISRRWAISSTRPNQNISTGQSSQSSCGWL